MSKPLLYVWLGAAGSGRQQLVRDVIEAGTEPTDRPVLLYFSNEGAPENDFTRPVLIHPWAWASEGRIDAPVPEGATHLFFITDGRGNPVDQIEALESWLLENSVELGRIITVVNSRLCHDQPKLRTWYEACIHFSDVVLLNRREELPQKWAAEFIEHFQKKHYPCLFELVKKERIRNPALLLHPETRRISTLFDEFPLDDEEEAELEEDEEEAEAAEEPYLERLPSGRRAREIPDINQFLEK